MKIIIRAVALVSICLLTLPTGWAQGGASIQAINATERAALFPKRATIESGRAAAQVNCFGCHGADGISDTEGKPHLAGQRTIYLYRTLKAFQSGTRSDIENNHNNFLDDEALLSTAIYYSSLAPATLKASADSDETTETTQTAEESAADVDDPFFGIREAMKRCVKCHGESGNASGSGMPSLTAQDPEYFVTSMMAYVNGSRSHNLMKRLVGRLDEETIREMGVFYAVQEPLQTKTLGDGDVNVGRRLAEECESCHGIDGNAKQASMPTLAGMDAKYFIKAMKHYQDGTRQHKNMFGAVESLSEQDIIDMASFYATQEPRRRNVRRPLNSTEWIYRCERCHGIDGNSSDPRFPSLAGQDETYLKKVLKAFATGEHENRTMHAMSDPLSAMDIERISAYFAAQHPKAVVYMQLPCEDNGQQQNNRRE